MSNKQQKKLDRVEGFIQWAKNHRIVSSIIIIAIVISAILKFSNLIVDFYNKAYKARNSKIVADFSEDKKQVEVGSVNGDYVAGNKIINENKVESPTVNKLDQYPKYKNLRIEKGYIHIISFPLFGVHFSWSGDDVIILIKLPDESGERAYQITEDTSIPFSIQVNTKDGTYLIMVEEKDKNGLQLRTFFPNSP